MRFARIFVIVIVAAALVTGFLVDDRDRPIADVTTLSASSVPVVAREGGVWFCPGGSAAGGVAEVSLELINIGDDVATAVVAGVRSGTGEDAREATVVVEPGTREIVRLTELVPDSAWMGAVVEVTAVVTVVDPYEAMEHITSGPPATAQGVVSEVCFDFAALHATDLSVPIGVVGIDDVIANAS